MTEPTNSLPAKLEALTELAIDKLEEVLREPLDVENGPLMRSQATAAAVAINAQLRADALRMRGARGDKALDRLIELIASKEITVPCVAAPDGTRNTASVASR